VKDNELPDFICPVAPHADAHGYQNVTLSGFGRTINCLISFAPKGLNFNNHGRQPMENKVSDAAPKGLNHIRSCVKISNIAS